MIGLPDEKWGQAINALVEPHPGATIDQTQLRDHVKANLAAYKAPKAVFEIDTVGRANNGKLDYRALTALAAALATKE